MNCPDLEIYSYNPLPNQMMAYSVGWLEQGTSFNTGFLGEIFHESLREIYQNNRIFQRRGFHECSVCGNFIKGDYGFGQREVTLGSCEILIMSKSGKLYICPDMILHYTQKHNYLPPQEFVKSVEELGNHSFPNLEPFNAWPRLKPPKKRK